MEGAKIVPPVPETGNAGADYILKIVVPIVVTIVVLLGTWATIKIKNKIKKEKEKQKHIESAEIEKGK